MLVADDDRKNAENEDMSPTAKHSIGAKDE